MKKLILFFITLTLLTACEPIDGYTNYNIFTGYETTGETNEK